MKYLVLKEYINRDGELFRVGECVNLLDDNFTKALIEHRFVVDYSFPGLIQDPADRISDLAEKLTLSFEKIKELEEKV